MREDAKHTLMVMRVCIRICLSATLETTFCSSLHFSDNECSQRRRLDDFVRRRRGSKVLIINDHYLNLGSLNTGVWLEW